MNRCTYIIISSSKGFIPFFITVCICSYQPNVITTVSVRPCVTRYYVSFIIGLFTVESPIRIITPKCFIPLFTWRKFKKNLLWWIILCRDIFPIYFLTLQELIPMLEGAMCWYGVLNANNPYGFISLLLKLLVPFVYLYWIVFDISNKKCKTEPMIGRLARLYIIIFPLLMLESIFDIIYFGGLNPIKVTCCF